jgi:aspartate/methionine/tyrosine aminotransferase
LLLYHGARVERIPIIWNYDIDPAPDLERLDAALKGKPKLVVFSHPNNPTGAVFSPATIRRLADMFIQRDVLVLLDALYARLVYDELAYEHMIAQPGMSELTVSLLGPSKAESMSGFRVGTAVGPGWVIDAMEDVLSVAALRAPAYAQHTLTKWIRDDEDYMRTRVADFATLRDWTVRRLKESELFEVRNPLGGSYVYPRPSRVETSEQELALTVRRDAGLLVNPGYQFGRAWRGHFRMCFAQEESAWDEALDRLIACVRRLELGG